jgi:hypothetical protein
MDSTRFTRFTRLGLTLGECLFTRILVVCLLVYALLVYSYTRYSFTRYLDIALEVCSSARFEDGSILAYG